jgi:vacuolar-type H+-ATPase subunit I/STV1
MRIRVMSPRSPLVLVAALFLATAGALAQTTAGNPLVAERIRGFQTDAAKLSAKVDEDQRAVDGLTSERVALHTQLQDAIGSIDARLRAGTTPANPDLVAQWQQAQVTLTHLDESFAKLSQVSATLAESSALADYLANSVHAAFELPGARDDDHRQLVALEAQANDASDHVRRLIDSLNRETDQEETELDAAHRNMVTLRHAVDIGAPLGDNLATMGRAPR